jgi:hypothetical protein
MSPALADLLLKALASLIGACLLAVLSWLAVRIWRVSVWLLQEKITRELRAEAEKKEREELLAFRLIVLGDGSEKHPGILRSLEQAKEMASAVSTDYVELRQLLGISERSMVAIQRNAIRRRLGLTREEPETSEESPPPVRLETGGHRALPSPTGLTAPAQVRPRRPMPFRGTPDDDPEDDDKK